MLARWQMAMRRWRRKLRHRRRARLAFSRRLPWRVYLGGAAGVFLAFLVFWSTTWGWAAKAPALAHNVLGVAAREGQDVRAAVTGWLDVSPTHGVELLRQTLPAASISDMESPMDFGWRETLRRWIYQALEYDLAQPKTLLIAGLPGKEQPEQNVVLIAAKQRVQAQPVGESDQPTEDVPTPAQKPAVASQVETEATVEKTEPLPAPSSKDAVPSRSFDGHPNLYYLQSKDWGTEPLVLIYHTHTSEMYLGSATPVSSTKANDAGHVFNTTDTGVVRVGRTLAETLNDRYGIPVVHSVAIHDWPDHSEAYIRSERTIRENLEKYPSIKMVIDVHRDGAEGVSFVRRVSDQDVSQVMLVIGKPDSTALHPRWQENLAFAKDMAARMEQLYPGLLRLYQGQAVNVKSPNRYNQHLHPASVLLEVGTLMDEEEAALRSAKMMADVVAAMLDQLDAPSVTSPVRKPLPTPPTRPTPVLPSRPVIVEPPTLQRPQPTTRHP